MSLEALERSDMSRLPAGIFTRAFVRAYAQEVGLDPDRTIQDFIAEMPPEATPHPSLQQDAEQLESDRKAVATAMKLILVSLPIAGFIIYYGMRRPPRPGTPAEDMSSVSSSAIPGDPTRSTQTAPGPYSIEPAAALVSPGGPPAVASRLAMEIATKANCWVSVTVDGEQMFSGLMHAGDTRHIAARDEISLNVGDAGAFAYTLNGKPGRPLGAPGEVVSRRITLADSKDYIIP
jgi:cytoskeleton protein RodZ